MARIPESEWVWYGYAGHFINSKACVYHLSTRIGSFLISTLGDYRPRDNDKYQMVEMTGVPDSFFETMVFRCKGEDDDGNPYLINLNAIEAEHYPKSLLAEKGHRRICEKYASLGESDEP